MDRSADPCEAVGVGFGAGQAPRLSSWAEARWSHYHPVRQQLFLSRLPAVRRLARL